MEEYCALATCDMRPGLMHCQAYLELRQGLNPEQDFVDRLSYLRKVIARRKELEMELKKKE